MSFCSEIDRNNFFVHQIDNVNVRVTSSTQVIPERQTQRLRVLGITLLFIGLLLVAGGIAVTISLSNPIFFLLILTGLILTVLAFIFLIKAERLHKQSGLTVTPILTVKTGSSIPEPSIESEDAVAWSEIVSDFQGYLKEKFPIVIDETLRDENRGVAGKVFASEKGFRLAFVKGSLEKLRYNPFEDEAKTVVVCEAYSDTEVVMRRYLDKVAIQSLNSTPALRPGDFALLNYGSSETLVQQHLVRVPWSFLCRFGGPFLGVCAFEPDTNPEIISDSLFSGFKNLFNVCIQQGINVVQVPLFSFAPGMPQVHRNFFEMAIVMVISDALELLYEERPDFGSSLCVNIVSPDAAHIYNVVANI